MKNSDDPEKVDIKDKFFEQCEELEIGQIVAVPTFKLFEAMSSVELMDPKMDTGMRRAVQGLGLQKAISEGLLDGDSAEIVTTIDATLALMVSWLDGGSLAQTLWTNVMLKHLNELEHPTYAPFCHAITHIVQMVTYVITNSYTYEEEDFQAHTPFPVSSNVPRDQVVRDLREVVSTVSCAASNFHATRPADSKLLLAIGARMEMCALFIEVLTWLVPPQSPQLLKVLSIYNQDNQTTSCAGGAAQNGANGGANGGEEGVQATLLGEAEKLDHQAPFTRSESNHAQSQLMTRRFQNVVEAMHESSDMGNHAPNGEPDGNFGWLTAIEPDLNKRVLPSAFPRKVVIPDRKAALRYLVLVSRRLNTIASKSLESTKDLTHLFFFARSFNLNDSCVLTRSVLQLAIFPLDEHISGDPKKSVVGPIETSLKEMFPPLILDKYSPVYQDKMAQQLYNNFLTEMSKLALSVYQNFGTNLARQRDRIIVSIEDLGNIQRHANRVEYRTAEIVRENSIEAPHQSIATFVLFNLISLVTHYFELSLRMDLFVPYEFPYIYWYMSDILARWQISTLERSQEINLCAWKQNPLSTSISKRTSKEKLKAEETLRLRFKTDQCHTIHQFGMSQIADGVVKMTIALIKLKKIKKPDWSDDSEKQRYDNRMAPMQCLGHPLYISYEQYLILSKVGEVTAMPTAQIIEEATEKFESAIHQLVRLADFPEFHVDKDIYINIARSNLIAAKLLLKLKDDIHKRRVEWTFSEKCMIYPVLKIS